MFFMSKTIKKFDTHFPYVNEKEVFKIGLKLDDGKRKIVEQKRLEDIMIGKKVLPHKSNGKVSLFNSEGKVIVQKDKPKERKYISSEATITDWHGGKHHVSRSIPRMVYPRVKIEAPMMQFTFLEKEDLIIVGDVFEKGVSKEEEIIHAINLCLELFDEVKLFNVENEELSKKRLKVVDWEMLPKGRLLWSDFSLIFDKIVKKTGKKISHEYKERLEYIDRKEPDFIAYGKKKFKGYVAFGFEKVNLVILENPFYGNATYVVDNDWELVSQLTKQQLQNEYNFKARIVHDLNWEKEIDKHI